MKHFMLTRWVPIVSLLMAIFFNAGCVTKEPKLDPPAVAYEVPRSIFLPLPAHTAQAPAISAATTQASIAVEAASNHYNEVVRTAPQVEPSAREVLRQIQALAITLHDTLTNALTNDRLLDWYRDSAVELRLRVGELEIKNGEWAKAYAIKSNEATAAWAKREFDLKQKDTEYRHEMETRAQNFDLWLYGGIAAVCSVMALACGVIGWISPLNHRVWWGGAIFFVGGSFFGLAGMKYAKIAAQFGIVGLIVIFGAFMVGVVMVLVREIKRTKQALDHARDQENVARAVIGGVEQLRITGLLPWNDRVRAVLAQSAKLGTGSATAVKDVVDSMTISGNGAMGSEYRDDTP